MLELTIRSVSAYVLALGILAAPLCAQKYHKLSGSLTRSGSTMQSWVLTPDGSRVVFDRTTSSAPRAILSSRLDGEGPAVSLTGSLTGTPQSFAVSPDGSQVVVLDRSGPSGSYQYRLYSVPVTGGTPVLLSAASGPAISSFLFAVGGARVVYRVSFTSPARNELWSAPTDGSAPPVMLNEPLTAGGSVFSYSISPGGMRVLYTADQDTDGVIDLYSVPPDRSLAPTRLNVSQPWADVVDFQVSYDNFTTLYRADQDTDGKLELYITSTLGGTTPVKRSGPLVAGGNVTTYQLASADHRLVFRADAEKDEVFELYAIDPTVPGARVKLSGTMPGDRDVQDARVSPDGSLVAYRSNQESPEMLDLYGVPATGTAAPIQLNGLFELDPLSDYRIAGATGRVLFHRDMGLGSKQLYSVPMDGSSAAVRLNGELVELGNTALMEAPSADVLFTADTDAHFLYELFRASSDGSTTPVRLYRPTVSGSWVKEARVTSDGTRAVFLVEGSNDELHCVSLASGESTRISGLEPDPAGTVVGSVQDMAFSNDRVHALYLAAQEGAARPELYGVRLDGTGNPVRLSSTIGESILDFVTSLDGRRVVYRIGDPDLVLDLRSAPVDEAGSEVVLERDSTAFDGLLESVRGFVLAPDRESVVYSVASGADTVFKRGRLDGSKPPALLLTWPGATEHHLSPDGSWLVFESPTGLHSYPLDGHQTQRRLDLAGVDFAEVAFTPDSSRVVFSAGGGAENGLFVALVDGSLPAVRLGGHPMGTVAQFELTSAGTEALFLADMGEGAGVHLYRVPVDGSASPTWLSTAPVAFFQIDSGSGRAVYSTSGQLYSVPIQGGIPPTHLASGTIRRLLENPVRIAQGHVVYSTLVISCSDHSDTLRLYSVPVTGGEVPKRLDYADCSQGVFAEVELTNSGRTVLCAFKPSSPSVRAGLYGVPIDGSSSARRMEGPLFGSPDIFPSPGFARDFRISPDGEYLLCRSAPQVYWTRELFALRLHPRARRR